MPQEVMYCSGSLRSTFNLAVLSGSLFRESDFAFLLDGLVPIRRTNVVCAGNEDSLSECSFNGADGDPTCTHRDDVIIMCASMFPFTIIGERSEPT